MDKITDSWEKGKAWVYKKRSKLRAYRKRTNPRIHKKQKSHGIIENECLKKGETQKFLKKAKSRVLRKKTKITLLVLTGCVVPGAATFIIPAACFCCKYVMNPVVRLVDCLSTSMWSCPHGSANNIQCSFSIWKENNILHF